MRKARSMALSLATTAAVTLAGPSVVAAAGPAAAATSGVLRFDFGPQTGPVAADYVQVANTTLYDPERGYGLDRVASSRDRGAPDDLRRDFTNGVHGFTVDVPDGDYHVAVTAGDQIASNRTGVTMEGQDRGQVSSAAGRFATLAAVVTVEDGRLDLEFRNDGRVNGVVVTPVQAPEGLQVTAIETLPDSSVTLTWETVEDAEGYRIYRAARGSEHFSRVGQVTGTEFTDDSAELGADYTYVVTQLAAAGVESRHSSPVDVSVVDPAVQPPSPPTGVRLATSTTQARTIAWEPVEDAALYRVQRATGADGPFENLGQTTDVRYVDQILPVSRAWYRVVALNAGGLSTPSQQVAAPATTVVLRQAEHLDRGGVAVTTGDGVLVSWRLLGTEPHNAGFHVYRDGRRITDEPIKDSTNYLDGDGSAGSQYQVSAVVRGRERARSAAFAAWAGTHRDIPLDKPADGVNPDGSTYSYRANDASAGDLDGDGDLELVLKWEPTNAQDNSRPGFTGETFLDAYELDGTRLWRIGMGHNIRSGAHYTQFLVYDFDGDGTAEVVAKTADGTTDGTGKVIGDANADHRNSSGYVLSGPEYLTVFSGRTGAALATTDYVPARGDVCDWGDCYGNRVDRFLAGVAYLDGERPSIVMARGYYTRTVLAAWDWRNGRLSQRWVFDSDEPGNEGYAGQGNHQLSVADVDGDSKDEIVYGAMAVDDDGTGLYTTGLGHGDAMHLSDLDPTRPGLEVFQVHEDRNAALGIEFRDADSGEAIWGQHTGQDTGRGLAADIDPQHRGAEAWAVSGAWNSTTGGLFTAKGHKISSTIPAANFAIWWDGDLGREILDHTFDDGMQAGVGRIDEWNPETGTVVNLLTATGTQSNNGTKGNPVLQADLLGDWREEVIWRTDDSNALRLYATPFDTEHRLPTLLHDPVYRLGIAWQNVGYNQPPHTSYFLGFDMAPAPTPAIHSAGTAPVDVRLAPRTWDASADGPRSILANLAPPAGVSADQVSGIRLVVDGHRPEAGTLQSRGGAVLWQATFDGPAVREALSGYTGRVELTVLLHLDDGRTLVGTDTVALE